MIKVYLIRLEGGGDIEEKFVDEEAWNWIVSRDMGQRQEDTGKTMWEDQNVPESVLKVIERDYKKYGITSKVRVDLTSGSWENDRALLCPSNVSLDMSKLDWGALRESLADQGFEYTGEIFEGCIY